MCHDVITQHLFFFVCHLYVSSHSTSFSLSIIFFWVRHPAIHPALSVCWSVRRSHFFSSCFCSLRPHCKCSGDLKYDPCPPAHDCGSRVSVLVISQFPLGESIFIHFIMLDEIEIFYFYISNRRMVHGFVALHRWTENRVFYTEDPQCFSDYVFFFN